MTADALNAGININVVIVFNTMTNTEQEEKTSTISEIILMCILSICATIGFVTIGKFLIPIIVGGTTEQYQIGYKTGYAEAKQMEGGKAYEAYVQNLADLCRRTTGEKVEGESDFFKEYLDYIVINKMESWSITCTKNN